MLLLKRLSGFTRVCWVMGLVSCLLVQVARAQVVQSAEESRHAFWVGGEYSNIHAGFPYQSNQRLWGIGGFADYHFTSHIDVEAEARFLRFNSFYGESEDNYLAGPRYRVGRFGKFQPYAQCLVGIGRIEYPFTIGSGQYFALAPGGGANYRISRKWSLRGEYEYQFWHGSPNFTNEPSHEITPNGFHVGIAYRLIR